MRGIAIYMEGGGKGKENRAALRRGMGAFLQPLREAARNKALGWNLVCCGPRDEAFQRFRNAVNNGDDVVNILLVDAEGPVSQSARAHLQGRDKEDLRFASGDTIHLMVQAMEAWVVADPAALATFYGRGFRAQKLPRAANLETVSRVDLIRRLSQATERTQKGPYHKIQHASHLLTRIDANKAMKRCGHCDELFTALGQMIAAA